ncbi:MAG: hypothetical protein QS721_04950 [Candidatus Endonucleobacter sp. (ex Gigantidas childressi)]|nr:hypothetical protein [Candidatus Endonucleobacter sp. (ex Gigantidas childressi)]
MPVNGKNPNQCNPETQFSVIIETTALNETELAEYCRKKVLLSAQIQQWENIFINNHSAKSGQQKILPDELKKDRKTIKNLEREITGKNKTLTESALTKKTQEI